MNQIPEETRAQVHVLASEGLPIERIAFLLRMSVEAVEKELASPTVSAAAVNTTKDARKA